MDRLHVRCPTTTLDTRREFYSSELHSFKRREGKGPSLTLSWPRVGASYCGESRPNVELNPAIDPKRHNELTFRAWETISRTGTGKGRRQKF